MEVTVNGDPQQVPPGTTVAELLMRLNLNPQLVAVERNRQIVRRGDHAHCVLTPHDRLEIVTLVGGG